MMQRLIHRLFLLLPVLGGAQAVRADELVKLPTRQTEEITCWWMPHSQPKATLPLFSDS